MSPPYHIAFTLTAGYIPQLQVLWASLFEHHAPGSLHLHLLHQDITPGQQSRLTQVAATRQIPCSFHAIPLTRTHGLPVNAAYPSPVQFLRFFLHEALPSSIDRVLYIDIDTLVCRSLIPLFKTDLRGCAVAAVEDLDTQASCKRLRIPVSHGYFNSGVMLMQLPTWRQHNITPRLEQHAVHRREDPAFWHYPDQDSLNVVLHDDRLPLPPEWNLYACTRWFQPRELSPARQAALAKPGILHFTGLEKPWLLEKPPPYGSLYDRYASQAGIRFPRPFLKRFTREYRNWQQRLETMRAIHKAAGLGADF